MVDLNIRRIRRMFCLAILLFSSLSYAQEPDTIRVLFVGNSYTYFWNLPQSVMVMAESKGIPVIARQSTAGGASWKDHWEGEKDLETRALIAKGKWDFVVLQNHSMSPIQNYDRFLEYGRLLGDFTVESGATPLFYETWAREYNPLTQNKIENGYTAIANEFQAKKIPVGSVWSLVKKARPDLRLFDPDGSHPSPTGTYLIACVFFRSLTGEPALGLPNRLITKDKDGEPLYLSILPARDVEFLQLAVDEYFEMLDTQRD